MDDNISREAARSAFLRHFSKNTDRKKSAIDWHNTKVILGSIPAADVRPVVRGEWIWTETGKADYEQFWVCSECGDHTFIKSNYCPNCGADMRPEVARDD